MKFCYFFLLIIVLSCRKSINSDPIISKESAYFERIETNDIKLGIPKQGEWLFHNKEKGQTFEQYKNSKFTKIDKNKFIIYLKPIGDFTNLQTKHLELTREYLEIFFQRKVILMKPISDNFIPQKEKRMRSDGSEQVLAGYLLNSYLKGKMPKDGVVLMAISEKDLFPKPEWNYVFGLASYSEKVGVTSIFRFQSKDKSLTLRRLINVASHEIGHMFSIKHCINAHCTMNGSISLDETDLCPNRLCSECQKKLFYNFRYDNKKRLDELAEYFKRNNLLKDNALMKLDDN
jgi:archaemetzincin